MIIKKFESFNNSIHHIQDLKPGNIIIYQGSKYEVLSPGSFSVAVKSIKTKEEFTINQSQLLQHGIKLCD